MLTRRADTPSLGSYALKSAAGLAPVVLLNGAGNYAMLESLVGRGVAEHGRCWAAVYSPLRGKF